MIEPFTIHPATPGGNAPPLILEAPHTSRVVPFGVVVPSKVLDSHEGWDIGVPQLFRHLQRELGAWGVTSNRSRKFVEHNRVPEHCLETEPKLTSAESHVRLEHHHKPYIEAVSGLIADKFVAQDRLPALVCVHTCEPELDGKKRKPFIVGGDEDFPLVLAFERILARNFRAIAAQMLSPEILTSDETEQPVALNDPFDLRRLSNGKPNRFWEMVQAPHYARDTNLPWVLVETRNDRVSIPAVQMALLETVREVMGDSEVRADLEHRQRACFGASCISSRPGRSWHMPAGAK